ncbi:type II secretion system protein [Candidatus Saccharibacteria bacterium]|nr:type II secretion system protein [Candidatus Saccharibacteria bacterium]
MSKKGFTLIEVVLFLAISGGIFAMIMTGISTSTARRRYNDSVNDLVEQIRNAYSATINVENYRVRTEDSSYFCSISSAYKGSYGRKIDSKDTDNYPGRSRCAVYGQLVTFGEQNNTRINRYDIIGLAEIDPRNNIDPDDSDELIQSLKAVWANVINIRQNNTAASSCSASLAGTTSSYLPQWDATIENLSIADPVTGEQVANRSLYRGAILIARSPVSGTVHTFFYTDKNDIALANAGTLEVQNWLSSNSSARSCDGFYNANDYFIINAINNNRFKNDKDLNICVGSEDLFGVANRRRAIRVHADGSTESAVELLSESESVDVCRK